MKVTLSTGDPRHPLTVYRKMKMDKESGGQSEWKINGQHCPVAQLCVSILVSAGVCLTDTQITCFVLC